MKVTAARHSLPSTWIPTITLLTMLLGVLPILATSVSDVAEADDIQGTVVGGTCADGSTHAGQFDCQAYLCGNGWAQAHGLGSYCAGTSSYNPIPGLENTLKNLTNERNSLREKVKSLQNTNSQLQDTADNLTTNIALVNSEIASLNSSNAVITAQTVQYGKDDAEKSMKGFSSADTFQDQGTGSNFFGVKSISQSETMHSKSEAARHHVVKGAWHQLNCSEYLAGLAANRALNATTLHDLDDIKYLANQSANVMSGAAITEDCQMGGQPPLSITDNQAIQYRRNYDAWLPILTARIIKDATIIEKKHDPSSQVNQEVTYSQRRVDALIRAQNVASSSAASPTTSYDKPASDDALARALRALAMAQKAQHQLVEDGNTAQKDLSALIQANSHVTEDPAAVDVVFTKQLSSTHP